VNHVRYAADLAEAISQVNDEMMQIITLVGIMAVEDMRRRVEELYVKLFYFLRKAMEWYASKSRSKLDTETRPKRHAHCNRKVFSQS
jgi:hypothetical protein